MGMARVLGRVAGVCRGQLVSELARECEVKVKVKVRWKYSCSVVAAWI